MTLTDPPDDLTDESIEELATEIMQDEVDKALENDDSEDDEEASA